MVDAARAPQTTPTAAVRQPAAAANAFRNASAASVNGPAPSSAVTRKQVLVRDQKAPSLASAGKMASVATAKIKGAPMTHAASLDVGSPRPSRPLREAATSAAAAAPRGRAISIATRATEAVPRSGLILKKARPAHS